MAFKINNDGSYSKISDSELIRPKRIENREYCCELSWTPNSCGYCDRRYCEQCKRWMEDIEFIGNFKLKGKNCADCRSKNQPRYITSKMRFYILARDKFTCRYCGESAPKVKLHIDHIKPISKGGDNSLNNLVTACQNCNLGKSNSSLI